MRRGLLIAAVLAGGVAPGAGTPAGATRAPFAAALVACHHGLADDTRYLDVRARIDPIAGSRRVAIRFALLWRHRGARAYRAYASPGLGRWESFAGGLKRYDKRIQGLPVKARYRVVVSARWYRRDGRVLRNARVETGACLQPDLRADLHVTGVKVTPVDGSPTQDRYAITVRNRGRTAAGAFAVGLLFPGGLERRRNVAGLGVGDTVKISFRAPTCTDTAPPTVEVDPDNAVDEADEGDSERPVACPAA